MYTSYIPHFDLVFSIEMNNTTVYSVVSSERNWISEPKIFDNRTFVISTTNGIAFDSERFYSNWYMFWLPYFWIFFIFGIRDPGPTRDWRINFMLWYYTEFARIQHWITNENFAGRLIYNKFRNNLGEFLI